MENNKNKNTIHNNDTTNETMRQTRITCWKKYNNALIARGNIQQLVNNTLFRNTLELHQVDKAHHGKGRPRQYTDAVIFLMLAIKEIFALDLRRTEGFTKCLFAMYGVDLEIPSYTTLSRRLGRLHIHLNISKSRFAKSIVALVDSTGMQVSGEGNWFRHKHGRQRKRHFIKEHLLVDYSSMQIIGWSMTPDYIGDTIPIPDLLDQAMQQNIRIIELIGDGAYDGRNTYKIAAEHHINLLAPPPKNAKLHTGEDEVKLIEEKPEWILRNDRVARCREVGREKWKIESNYHRRSLVETQMFRLKSAFTGKINSRLQQNQYNEMAMRIYLLNGWTNVYMPTYTA